MLFLLATNVFFPYVFSAGQQLDHGLQMKRKVIKETIEGGLTAIEESLVACKKRQLTELRKLLRAKSP